MPLKAKPIIYSVPSNDVGKSREFYAALLGADLVAGATSQVQVFNGSISQDGIDISVIQRHTQQETPFIYFAVDDLAAAIKEAEGLGSALVWGPASIEVDAAHFEEFAAAARAKAPGITLTPQLGQGAILLDPGGSQFGLMQLASEIHSHFKIAGTVAQTMAG